MLVQKKNTAKEERNFAKLGSIMQVPKFNMLLPSFFIGAGGAHNGSTYLEGCLDGIYIQGEKLDLDQAVFKDSSVSSHSCPV